MTKYHRPVHEMPVKVVRLWLIGLFTLILAGGSSVLPSPLFAWSIHPLIMKPALSSLPEVKKAAPVEVRSLKQFLMAVESDLEKELIKQEKWFENNLEWYQPLPKELAFKATGDPDTVQQRFAYAMRINPNLKSWLYLQRLPGESFDPKRQISVKGLTFLSDTDFWKDIVFVGLQEGERVSALDVIATASDDPDFGLDIGLYENNDTDFGGRYGFGEQPFGDPKLEYGSQAPIHMGFYHEAKILQLSAGYLLQTYPEYRIHQYQTLAKLAFRKGEDYWGWRFLGWGLHYLIDLQQPYHAKVFPGLSTGELLWINAKVIAGAKEEMDNAIQLLSNRHSVFEQFQQQVMTDIFRKQDWEHPVYKSLKQTGAPIAFYPAFPREVVAKEAYDLADHLDEVLLKWSPEKFVSDPTFEFGDFPEQEKIIEIIRQGKGDEAVEAFNQVLIRVLQNLPEYSRAYINSATASK